MKANIVSAIGGFSGAVAVMLGALGAHALRSVLSPELLESFLTGNRYHILHSIVLLVLGYMLKKNDKTMLRWAANLILVGMILFSISIYLLSTRFLWEMEGLSWLGPITPIGGLLLILGWILIGISFLRNPANS